MKYLIVFALIVFSISNDNAMAEGCRVKIDKENFDFAFGAAGLKATQAIFKKKNLVIVSEGESEYILSGYRRISNSPWDMWSPISPRWSFKSVEQSNQQIDVGGYIQGRTFFDSEKRRARKLKAALKRDIPVCRE